MGICDRLIYIQYLWWYIQNLYWFVRSYSTKIKLSMYKAGLYYTRSQQNISHPSLSSPKNLNAPNKFPITEKLDLKKINEYLQDKISRKLNKNRMKDSKRGEVQVGNYNQNGIQYQRSTPTMQRQRFPQNRQDKDYSNEKVRWKRHESIEKLLEKQNKQRQNYLQKNYMPQSESNSMQVMEQKYQQLQQKYKKLMQDTIISNKQFQQNQKELQALKQKRLEDQQTLIKLKTELMNIQMSQSKHNSVAQTDSKKVQTIKSQQIIESDVSIANSQVPQKSWKSKQFQKNELKNSVVYSKGNKTTQSWMSKANTSSVPQFHQPSSRYQSNNKSHNYQKYDDRKSNRYYSAEKMASNTRRNSKTKKNCSDVIQYTEIESKTTIKFGESLSNSKVKIPQKYITPTNLHKKVITSNQYSKYRFQPTVRLN